MRQRSWIESIGVRDCTPSSVSIQRRDRLSTIWTSWPWSRQVQRRGPADKAVAAEDRYLHLILPANCCASLYSTETCPHKSQFPRRSVIVVKWFGNRHMTGCLPAERGCFGGGPPCRTCRLTVFLFGAVPVTGNLHVTGKRQVRNRVTGHFHLERGSVAKPSSDRWLGAVASILPQRHTRRHAKN